MPALPPLASLNDLRVWVSPAQADDEKADAALAAASALVRAYTERPTGWADPETDPVPDPVREATLNVARRRALTRDDSVVDQAAGPFSVKRDTGLWLSAADKLLLDSYRAGGGVTSMRTRSTLSHVPDTVFVPTGQPGSDPIPWE